MSITPPPWKVIPSTNDTFEVISEDLGDLSFESVCYVSSNCHMGLQVRIGDQKDNAILIAAAPALQAEVERLKAELTASSKGYCSAVERANDAIIERDALKSWQASVMAEVGPEPNFNDYITKWRAVRIAPSMQEAGARQEYAADSNEWLQKSALNLAAKLREAQKPLLMANGTTTLYEYLKSSNPAAAYMDDWTVGYETCKQRLFNVVGPQLSATNVMPAPLTDVPAHDDVLLRQALAALEHHREQTRPIAQTETAIAAIRERLVPQPLGDSRPDSVMPADLRAQLDAQRQPWNEMDEDVQSLMDRDHE